MKNIILIAAPAAGKGTQAKLIEEKYGLIHISTGDLLRSEVSSNSELGIELDKIMKKGQLVNDEIVEDLLRKKINSSNSNGFVLEGYPRNLNQASRLDVILNEINKKIDYVIYLDVPFEVALKRSSGRLQCKYCGKIYNLNDEKLRPLKNGICNNCGKEIYQRNDDNEESFKIRFNTYLENTKPLIDYYKSKGLLKEVDSSKDCYTVFSSIENIIGK